MARILFAAVIAVLLPACTVRVYEVPEYSYYDAPRVVYLRSVPRHCYRFETGEIECH